MTPETIEHTVETVANSDRPFMVLFVLVLLVCIVLAFKILSYFEKANSEHQSQLEIINEAHKKERDTTYKMFADEQIRAHVREEKLFQNLEQNTKQLGEVADTLKQMKFDFSNLESRVGDLSDEFVKLKTQVTKHEDHE